MIRSGFFNSVNQDRKYNASHFAEYFATFIGDGVFPNPSDNLQIIANNDNMTVTVRPGKAWINGYILINDDDYILNIEPADGVLSRIDRIVARYDTVDREIRIEVKKGIFTSSPVAPTLQRDADAYELGIADIYIGKGVISITQANITDLRLNSDLCGIVHGTVDQVDTTTLFAQYESWYNQTIGQAGVAFENMQQQLEQEFLTWFATLQGILDENTATNLLNMINNLQTEVTEHKDDLASQEVGKGASLIGLNDSASNFESTNVEGALDELFTNVNDGKGLIATAIIDKGGVATGGDTFNELASAISQISTTLRDLVAGNTIIYNKSDTVTAPFGSMWTVVRSIRFLTGGSVRIRFNMRSEVYVGDYNSVGAIYINDIAVGTNRFVAPTAYVSYTEDFNINVGDILTLRMYCQHPNQISAMSNLFQVKVSENSPLIETIL